MGATAGVTWAGSPRTAIAARRRRRNILVALIGAALVSFIVALYAGGLALLAHLFFDALLLGYIMLLVQHQRLNEEQPPLSAHEPQGYYAEPDVYPRTAERRF